MYRRRILLPCSKPCTNSDNMQQIKLENSKVVLRVNTFGGSYSDFHLKESPLNPINWEFGNPEFPPYKGHFLCFDRWGPPSEGEKINGFQHHGEVNTVEWRVLDVHQTECEMMCTLPMGGLQLKRKIRLSENEPVFFVTEEITNLNKYGRMYNIVQHVTIAPPFLDDNMLIDNNTEKGFENREDGSLNQEESVLKWPEVIHNGEKISLRQFQNDWPRVSSFMFEHDEKRGWVTASNPGEKLMLGYIWETEDYPWINFWRDRKDGVPKAYGIEFGTTGLHEPFPVVAKKGKIFDRNLYDFIDAGETISKSFIAFLAEIPDDYKGVGKIEISESIITVKEKSKNSREILFKIY